MLHLSSPSPDTRLGARFSDPRDAVGARTDRTLHDLAAAVVLWLPTRNELEAITALLVSVGFILILHGCFGGLCLSKGRRARHQSWNCRATRQKDDALHKGTASNIWAITHFLAPPRGSETPSSTHPTHAEAGHRKEILVSGLVQWVPLLSRLHGRMRNSRARESRRTVALSCDRRALAPSGVTRWNSPRFL